MDNALVTGASGGLGEQYARYFARRGHPVFIAARSGDRLEALAKELRAAHRVEVTPVVVDLADRDDRARFVERMAASRIGIVVNNAGFGTIGPFLEAEPKRITDEIELNCVALTELTRAVLPAMLAERRGAVINMASTAAYQPIPSMAVYAATKAYVLSFTQALWAELRGTGIKVIAVCPGPTETGFFDRAGDASMMRRRRSPEQVVQTTMRALRRGAPSVVDGPANSVLAHLSPRLPTRVVLSAVRSVAGL